MTERRRRPQVVGVFLVSALVVGTVLLGISLHLEPGTGWFYPAALALALTWVGGALLAGRPPLGRSPLLGVAAGLGLAAVFVVGALAVREIPALGDLVGDVTAYAERGGGFFVGAVAVVTGAAEEVYFRGALYDAVRRPVITTTVIYTVVTIVTGNVMLVLAAALLGAVAAVLRHRTGGVIAPILTHVTWSVAMLLALPALF